MSMLAGLKFILSTSFFKNEKQGEERVLNLPNGNTPVLLYCPSKREKGLIISLTGFSMSGYQDKRIAAVNHAFAKLGYRVMTPKIETIDALLIHPSGIDEVKEVIQSIAKDPILNPNQFRPAVFAPSFTAGIGALAVAELPENSVSALCLLGGFCDFETTIEFALTNEKNEDDYVVSDDDTSYLVKQLINTAAANLGANYKSGGTTPEGYDCSGLMYATFKKFDIV